MADLVRRDQDTPKPSYWTTTASKEELLRFATSDLDKLHPDFVESIRATTVEGIVYPPLQMRDMPPPDLPLGKVTLLADAVHPMVPCEFSHVISMLR